MDQRKREILKELIDKLRDKHDKIMRSENYKEDFYKKGQVHGLVIAIAEAERLYNEL